MQNLIDMLFKASNIHLKDKEKTFFDVSGYPHYENVISNILAFFFDVNEEHGLRDLWIKSLFDCYNRKANTNLQPKEFEEVEREHFTEENKRLDIIVSLDNAIVAIENKIFADTYNPFDDYIKEIVRVNDNEKELVAIILSLKKLGDYQTKQGKIFYNITYKELFNTVKDNFGVDMLESNGKWLIFMKELLINIENLGASEQMDKEWQKFIKENEQNMTSFFDNYSKDIDAKVKYINNLYDNLNRKIDDELNENIISKGTYRTKNSESFRGHFSLFIDIRKGDETLVLEPYISRKEPAFLRIAVWNREAKKNDWSKEKAILQADFPDIKQIEDAPWEKCLLLEKIDFETGISLDELSNKLLGILNKLK
ncbi:MAG: PD-(D/E)XK nuclease family protein [Clostridia bacterium]|nr:PD-(D/E)XK nuclease family protein [Clostridia bacterium]